MRRPREIARREMAADMELPPFFILVSSAARRRRQDAVGCLCGFLNHLKMTRLPPFARNASGDCIILPSYEIIEDLVASY